MVRESEKKLVVKYAVRTYFKNNPDNNSGYTVEDALIRSLEEFDTGYDLTEQDYKKVLGEVSGEAHRRILLGDRAMRLTELSPYEDEADLRELLSTQKFTMFNQRYPDGNEEVFSDHDVNMIIGDMRMNESLKARAYVDEKGTLTVKYPGTVCTLISCDTIEEVK